MPHSLVPILKKITCLFLLYCFFFLSISQTIFVIAQSTKKEPLEIKNKHTTPLVSLLVEKEIYPQIRSSLEKYARSIAKDRSLDVLITPVSKNTSVLEIWEGLAQLYFSGENNDHLSYLTGVILIGNVPLPIVYKNERLWPSVFPYTDFDNPAYYWNEVIKRFEYHGGSSLEPEIWHGVIRPGGTKSERITKIKQYFRKNLNFRNQEKATSSKILFVDLVSQRQIPTLSIFRYRQWIKYLFPNEYSHYNKIFATKLKQEENEFQNTKKNSNNEDQNKNKFNFDQLPDIQSIGIINSYLSRYQEAYRSWLSLINTRIGNAFRWSPEVIDTTVGLVTEKDEAARIILRQFNDRFEKRLTQLIKERKIAAQRIISEGNTTHVNGVPINNITVSDCSLRRGTSQFYNSFAQQVDANRVYNPNTINQCQEYGGCCINNLKFSNNRKTHNGACKRKFRTKICTTTGHGLSEICTYNDGARYPIFDISYSYADNKIGPTGAEGCESVLLPLSEKTSNIKTLDTFFIHNEPTQHTLASQSVSMIADSLPVDSPRGISFYTHGTSQEAQRWKRLDFINIFNFLDNQGDLRQRLQQELEELVTEINKGVSSIKDAEINTKNAIQKYEKPQFTCSSETKKHTEKGLIITSFNCTKTVIDEEGNSTTNSIAGNTHHSYGTPLSINDFQDILNNKLLASVSNSIQWLQMNIEEKNKEVLLKSLSKKQIANSFFHQNSFDGYEVIEIISKGKPDKGMFLQLEPQDNTLDIDFIDAKLQSQGVTKHENNHASFLGENFRENFITDPDSGPNSSLEKKGCSSRLLPVYIGYLSCYFSAISDIGIKEIFFGSVRSKSQNNTAKIKNTENITNNAFSKIKISPQTSPLFHFANTKESVLILDFKIHDEKENLSTQQYDITLESPNKNFHENFSILPAKKIQIIDGEGLFILSKKKKTNETFVVDISLHLGENKIDKQSIKIIPVTHKLSIENSTKKIIAGDRKIIQATVHALDESGNIDKKINQKIELHMPGYNPKTFDIVNGKAIINYRASTKSGTHIIKVQSKNNTLYPGKTNLTVDPADPHDIIFDNSDSQIILGAKNILTAKIVDLYENIIHSPSIFSWSIDNDIVVDKALIDEDASTKTLEITTPKGRSILELKGEIKNKTSVKVTNSLLPKIEKSLSLSIVPIKISSTISKNKSFAGSDELVSIDVKILNTENKIINQNLELPVTLQGGNIKNFPKRISITNGIGRLNFVVGTQAGDYEIIIGGVHAPRNKNNFKILPGKPVKIFAENYENIIEIDQKEKISFDILFADAHGNTTLEKKSIKIKPSKRSQHLIDVEKIQYQEGENNEIKVHIPHHKKTGTLELIIQSEDNIIPDVVETELVYVISNTNISYVSPKASLGFILGFDAGNLMYPKNFAENFLFSGEVQSIATTAVEHSPAKQAFWVDTNGDTNATIKLQPAKMLSIDFEHQGEVLAQLQHKNNSDIFLNASQKKSSGVYLFSELPELPKYKGRNIYWQQERVMEIGEDGGVKYINPHFQLASNNKNIFHWQVSKNKEILFEVYFFAKNFNFNEDVLKNITLHQDKKYEIDNCFTGKSTEDPLGFCVAHIYEKENSEKTLGLSRRSIGNIFEYENLVWKEKSWRPGIQFASGNTSGESLQYGSGDDFILLGDPTISLKKNNNYNSGGFDKGIGSLIWKSPSGDIQQIEYGDINGDAINDVIVLSQDNIHTLYGFYNKNKNNENILYRHAGISAITPKKTKKIQILPSSLPIEKGKPYYQHLLVLNQSGKTYIYKNNNGGFSSKQTNLPLGIKNINVININNDKWPDVVFMNSDSQIQIAFGSDTGEFIYEQNIFTISEFLENHAEKFDLEKIDSEVGYLDALLVSFKNIKNVKHYKNFHEKISDSPEDFISLTKSGISKADLSFSGGNKVGDQIEIFLNFTTNFSLSEWKLDPNIDPRIEFNVGSFACRKCQENNFEKGLISSGHISPGEVTMKWSYTIKNIGEYDYFVTSLNYDQIDDIIIPLAYKKEDPKIFKIISNPNKKIRNPNKEVIDPKYINPYEVFSSSVDEQNISTNPPEVKGIPSKDSDGDGIPDISDTNPYLNKDETSIQKNLKALRNTRKNLSCGGGRCFDVPFSFALFAPGGMNIYIPPAVINYGFDPGTPLIQIPTTLYTPSGPIPAAFPPIPVGGPGDSPSLGVGGIYPSQFRMYIMPTTSGQIGIALCTGPRAAAMIPPLWLPNCFATVPPITNMLGSCPVDSPSSTDTMMNNSSSASFDGSAGSMQIGNKNKSLKDIQEPSSKNIQIGGVDVFSTWIQKQTREFTEAFRFPSLSFVVPQDASDDGSDNLENKNFDNFIDSFSQKDFLSIKTEDVTLSIPDINIDDLKNIKNQLERLKQELENITQHPGLAEAFDSLSDKTDQIEGELQKLKDNLLRIENICLSATKNKQSECLSLIGDIRSLLESLSDLLGSLSELSHESGELMRDVENFGDDFLQSISGLLKQLQDYFDITKLVDSLQEEYLGLLGGLEEVLDTIENYYQLWIKENKKRIQEWKDAESEIKNILNAIQSIFDIFGDFDAKCKSCVVDRGTNFSGLLNMILGGIDIPIIKLPRIPNIILDFSQISLGIEVIIPNIIFEKNKINLLSLDEVNLSEFSLPSIFESLTQSLKNIEDLLGSLLGLLKKLNETLNLITNINKISLIEDSHVNGLKDLIDRLTSVFDSSKDTFTKFNESLQKLIDLVGSFNLPKLPEVPDILSGFREILEQLKQFILQIPKLPLLPRPPEITNPVKDILGSIESALSFLDLLCFVRLGIAPIPEWHIRPFVERLTSRTSLSLMDFASPALRLKETSSENSKNIEIQFGFQSQYTLDHLLKIAKGFQLPLEKINQKLDDLPLTSQESSSSYSMQKIFAKDMNNSVQQSFAKANDTIHKLKKNINQRKFQNIFTQSSFKSLQTNIPFIRPLAAAEKTTPKVQLNPTFTQSDNSSKNTASDNPTLYYVNIHENKNYPITSIPLSRNAQSKIIKDGNQIDVFFSDGPDLYLKKNYSIQSSIKEIPSIKTLEWKKFQKFFAPSFNINSRYQSSSGRFSFSNSNNSPYFEWQISPQAHLTFAPHSTNSDNASFDSKRIGIVIKPETKKYEIRPITGVITKIKGNVKFKNKAIDFIDSITTKSCLDPKAEKRIFITKATLFGIDKSSRIEIRVPNQNQTDKVFREIILRSGEETVVDSAEVCVTRGRIAIIESRSVLESQELKEGDIIFDKTTIEPEENSWVQFNVNGSIPIQVNSNEFYQLNIFESQKEIYKVFRANLKSFYSGRIFSVKKIGKSFPINKFFYHQRPQ